VNVCLREDLRERKRQVWATRRIGKAISACLSLEEIFRVVTRELRRIMAFDASAIIVVDESGEDGRVMVGQAGKEPHTLPWSQEFQETVTGGVLRPRRAAIVPDVDAAVRPVLPFIRDLPGTRAQLSLPLVIERETVGALILTSRTRGRFRRADVRLLRPVAEQLAIAVRHARLLRATTIGLEERLRLEVRLARAERYATIGRLAGALAHEIRNPLTVIGTTVQYLRDRLPVEDERRTLLDAADRKVREMDESLEGLLSFSRPLELRLQPAPIEPILTAVAEFLRVRAGQQGVEVRVEAEPPLHRVMLDARLMEQAFLNLALNALDAMPSGGRLTFAARNAEDRNLLVIVTDTGVGIDDAQLAAIFEPYYTTKRRGTGLGLAVTRRIIEEHGGAIEATSEPGRGTTFLVILPAAPRDPPVAPAASPPPGEG
jgi:signal transduction histidine kinase